MASIVKRGKSYSVVHSIKVNGMSKQKWETYHTIEEALQRKKLLEICKQQHKVRENNGVETVRHLIENYVRLYGMQRWSLSTYQSNIGLIQNYILPVMGPLRLNELSPRVVAELYHLFLSIPKLETAYHKTHGQTISTCTLKSIHKVLHSVFEQAVLWEYTTNNPFHKAALPKTPKNPRPFLMPEQIGHLLSQCSDRILALAVHVAFAGSLRRGELLALTWQDVDFEQCSIRINKTVSRISRNAILRLPHHDVLYEFPTAKRETKTLVVLKQPKTESSIRTIYLPDTVMNKLYFYHKEQSKKTKPPLLKVPDLVFRHEDGRPIHGDVLCKWFSKELETAKLPPVVFHSLRHSSISYKLILSEGNIKAVQADSGHAQAEMVTDTYGHALDQTRRSTAYRFEQDFYKNI